MVLPYTLLALALAQTPSTGAQTPPKMGHSKHGSAFDSGLRSRPFLIPGIGEAPFPITTKNPEVQKYFNQANALMHNFWWEEAERSLRWCMKLEPENPMVYLALARCGETPIALSGRYRDFLNLAIKHKGKASERERMIIEAFETSFAPGAKGGSLATKLKVIVAKYPDDLEAKAMLSWELEGANSEEEGEKVRDQIRTVAPRHPGATHATIHAWDYKAPLRAADAAGIYAAIAPRVGHALHMPGHIFSKIGMWHEAARAMDSATRTELKYLNDRLAMPHETWNFQHNRNYLSFIQEQLGMANAALQGARDLLAAPSDPSGDNTDGGGLAWQGRSALIRGSIKFERYEDLLQPAALGIGMDDMSVMFRAWGECLAYAGLKDGPKARAKLVEMRAAEAKEKKAMGMGAFFMPPEFRDQQAVFGKITEALVILAEGDRVAARKALEAADASEQSMKKKYPIAGDPPDQPWSAARLLGDLLLEEKEPALALAAYQRALVYEPNCGFALSGLARASHALGKMDDARRYAGRLEYVWSQADPGLKWLESVRALKLGAKPIAETPRPERRYRPSELNHFGPSNWEPFAAPKLDARNVQGKKVDLSAYRGKNVVMVFYLGDTCVHCVEQLQKLNESGQKFADMNTVIVGISSAAPEANAKSLKLKSLNIQLLSDDKDHSNARRFASYDDFEEMELHSTILIDRNGKVRWKTTGGDPYMNVPFLLREVRRWGR